MQRFKLQQRSIYAGQNLRKHASLATETAQASSLADRAMAAHIIGSIGGTRADSVPIKRALLSVSDHIVNRA